MGVPVREWVYSGVEWGVWKRRVCWDGSVLEVVVAGSWWGCGLEMCGGRWCRSVGSQTL